MQALKERAPGLCVLAVRVDGRRAADAPVLSGALPPLMRDVLVVLDHAGPAAVSWSIDRALGAAETREPLTGRRARALGDVEWRAVTEAFSDAARACRAAGVDWALALDDDGLLHDALRYAPARAHEVVRACAPTCVVMPVEDLAPGGLDATDGVALARILVAGGATRLIASAGSRSLWPLRAREKGDTSGGRAALVAAAASAAWLVGRVDASIEVQIEGIVPHLSVELADVEEVARALGLARIWVERADHLEERGG